MTYKQYQKIFAIIDAGIWESAVTTDQSISQRVQNIEKDGERTKDILAEYIDRSVERMRALLTTERFSKLPTPRKRIPIGMRLSIRRELFQSMRNAPFGRHQDFESWKARGDRQASNRES